MRAYKFLDESGGALFSGFAWPLPADGRPGAWVEAPEVRPSYRGVHACRGDQLAYWLMNDLWEIELGGDVVEATHKVVAPRGRLVRHVDEWTDVAREHAQHCAWRARAQAIDALERAGDEKRSGRIAACATLAELAQAATFVEGLDPDSPTARLVTLIGDSGRAGGAGSVVGAPFVAACAAGTAAELAAGAYDDAFHAERRSQSAWLAARLAEVRADG